MPARVCARRQDVLAAGRGELPQQFVLLRRQFGGCRDEHVHEQVTAAPAAQVRYTETPDPLDVPVLRPRRHDDPLWSVERLDLELRSERRLRQGHLDPEIVDATLGCLLKDRCDLVELSPAALGSLVAEARGAS